MKFRKDQPLTTKKEVANNDLGIFYINSVNHSFAGGGKLFLLSEDLSKSLKGKEGFSLTIDSSELYNRLTKGRIIKIDQKLGVIEIEFNILH